MRFTFIILVASLLNTISLNANEQDLLASALKLQKTITPDLSAKDKLARYEFVISKIDQITEDYASTEIGLELLATDSIGNLDVKRLRSDYLKELIEYYDTTCKVSPSYACLGFVSLSTANEICEKPYNIDSYIKASENLINAIQIFDGQFDDNKYKNVALSIYRQCMQDSPDHFSRDYLNSQLIDTLLRTGEESKARGIIEQMKTPFFKINSVISLRKFQDQAFDSRYVERLKKAIYETIDNQDDRWLAENTLIIARLQGVIEGKNELWTDEEKAAPFERRYWEDSYKPYSIGRCGSLKNQYSFELTVKKLFVRAEQLGGKLDSGIYSNTKGDCEIQMTILQLMGFKDASGKLRQQELDKIINKETLSKIDALHKKLNEGVSVIEAVKNGLLSSTFEESDYVDDLRAQREKSLDHPRNIEIAQEVYDYYKKNPSVSISQAKLYFIDNYINSEIEADYFKKYVDGDLEVLYQIYKKKVDFGNACDASSILFKELVNSKHYEDGINYFTSSPSMDATIKYDCGDEDLELLLN
tara:strand:+ start:1990 stop:3582 length:1593 start_codon:yes stop_codon:yes gene_type:complete